MKDVIFVACGGAVGAVSRFKLSGIVLHHTANMQFPLPTFVVNLLGCLIAGVLAGLGERWNVLTPELRLLLFTGILGGFTTFSAFGIETTYLLKRGEVAIAIAYAVLSVVVGVGAVRLGMWATRAG